LEYSAVVKTLFLWSTLIVVTMPSAFAQSQHEGMIALSFSVDGTPTPCDGFQIELRLGGDSLKPTQIGQSFEIPEIFKQAASRWRDDQRVDIILTCGGHTLVFPEQHPALVRNGGWELGFARPLYALREYGYTHEFDHGACLGYLIFEGEPGVLAFSPQTNPPHGLSDDLRKEQLNDSPGRARDIAYTLAVFKVDYPTNRDYLLSSLTNCLLRPKDSAENSVCDGDLFSFVANLYWRGDSALLVPLLQLTESRRDVIDDIGIFYADLLDRRGVVALNVLGELSGAQQQILCRLADEDDLRYDAPKRYRVMSFLRGAKGGAATRCLTAFRNDDPISPSQH
jgi:hypothetical protein